MGIVQTKERLLANTVRVGECLEYQGSVGEHGYIRVRLNGVRMGAHKVMFILSNGDVPAGMVIRHTCDNRKCINPEHLILGTTQENTQDRQDRNRQAKGESQGNSKLSAQDVLNIRSSVGKTQRALGALYGVSQFCIWSILNNKQWRHL